MAENEGKAACLQYFLWAVPGKRRQAAPKRMNKRKKKPRTFNYKWKENIPWIKYAPEEDVMTCSLCIEYEQKAESGNLKNKHLFLIGCSNFRLTSITDHKKSKIHIQAKIE